MLAPYLVVALGGSIGAIARYFTVITMQGLCGLRFPYGTLAVNLTGSFIAGFLLHFFVGKYNASEYWRLFLFTGFLGAYTTFSSFAAENLLMLREEQWFKLGANLLSNNLGTLLMVFIGAFFAEKLVLGSHQP